MSAKAIIFTFDDKLGLGEFSHHEIEKTEDQWKTIQPCIIFEELQSFLKSHFVHVHQFCKLLIGEELYEISSRIVYELGDKTLALRNDQVDWMQLLGRHVDVQIECLFKDFNRDQVKNLEKDFSCGGSTFSARELLETSEEYLLKECLDNAEKPLQSYLCYYFKSKICGNIITVKVCQPSLSITKDITELECYIKWIIINQFKVTSSSVGYESNYLVEGRYELLYRLNSNLNKKKSQVLSNPLLNDIESNTIWVSKDFSTRKNVILKIGGRTENEFSLLSQANHPNILHFNDFYPSTESMLNRFIVYPDMGCDLYQEVHVMKRRVLTQSNIRKVYEQLVNAVAFLHKNNISHRDIKLQNLFFNFDKDHLWLADFDGSSNFTGSKKVSINGFTPKLNEPPEISLESKMSNACDVWGIGVVLYQLLTLDFTTSLVDDFKNNNSIYMKSKLESLENYCEMEDLIEIVKYCIQEENNRITIDKLQTLEDSDVSDELEGEIQDEDFKENVKKILAEDGMLLEDYEDYQDDKEMVEIAIANDYRCLQYASNCLKKDKLFLLDMIRKYPKSMQMVDKSLFKVKEFVIEIFKLVEHYDIVKSEFPSGMTANYLNWEFIADSSLKNDREIILRAVKQNGKVLQYVLNREIVLEAVKKNGKALEYVSNEFKSDREIVLEAVKQNCYALQYVLNREIVLEAVKQNGKALEYVSNEFKSDREIVLEAVKKNGKALQYVLNREIVLEAVKKNGKALLYVSNEFKSDREIILEAVKQNGYALQYVLNREIVLEAVKQNGKALEYVSNEFKSDREIVLEAVKKNGYVLKYASDELKSDREMVLEAVKQNIDSLKFASIE